MTVDELGEYGVEPMEDDEIDGFLSSRSLGVLGLPAEGAPYLVPLSFWFDGESRLYFLYVVGSRSRKAELTDGADAARFLVYSAETMFNWQSVLLTGTVDQVPGDERDAVEAAVQIPWRPDLFETATEAEETRFYCFEITEHAGIKHRGLPPGLADQRSG